MNILVTGGNGRLARYVIPRLVVAGHVVSAFDKEACALPEGTGVSSYIRGDLNSIGDCLRALLASKAEAIVHFGAIAGSTELGVNGRKVQRLPEDECMRSNVMGTYCLLDSARRLGIRRVIMASSFFVLGLEGRLSGTSFVADYLPIDEDHPLRPEDSYSLSKLLGEEILEAFTRAYSMTGVAFRLLGVLYPNEGEGTEEEFPMTPRRPQGAELTTFQYVDARDVAEACVLAIEANYLTGFEAFYLTTDMAYRRNTRDLLIEVWPEQVGVRSDLGAADGIITDGKARTMLGYKPKHARRPGM